MSTRTYSGHFTTFWLEKLYIFTFFAATFLIMYKKGSYNFIFIGIWIIYGKQAKNSTLLSPNMEISRKIY